MNILAEITLVNKINSQIINPLIGLLFALALIYFLYGGYDYLSNVDNSKKKGEGLTRLWYGLIGMFLIIAVSGIINLIAETVKNIGNK